MTQATLDIGEKMSAILSTGTDGDIGVIAIDSPPVNALGVAVRQALTEGLRRFSSDSAVKAVVLICGGRTFFAGFDIAELGGPPLDPDLRKILDDIENYPKPVVAAIHGTALGGGLEVALACHYRVAVPSAKVGLPEVNLGVLPGAGGTQRLTRVAGVEAALDIMTSGRQVGSAEARQLGVIDEVVDEGGLREDAIAFARRLVAENRPLARIRDREDKVAKARGKPEIFAEFRRKNARLLRRFTAPESIVKTVEAAVELPFAEGLAREKELFEELAASRESAALRHVFFAERQTSKIPDLPKDTPILPVESVGIVGAGTMGGGIAMNFLNAGIPVVLVEMKQDALDRGIAVIRRNYDNTVNKGRLTQAEVEARMALIRPALDIAALADCDLIVEAVYEEMGVKREVFGRIDAVAKPQAILASNTSFLDIDEIAAATGRPDRVLGLHFFSPANVMRLLEVVRGANTAPELLATAMQLARRIGKVPVLARVCHGFIANRIMEQRALPAQAMLLEGVAPQRIDTVLKDYGFAMGEFEMMDLVGLDVIGRGATERTVPGDLVEAGRLGQKQGGGYYDYDENRRPRPSAVTAGVIAAVAAEKRIAPRPDQGDEDILLRLLLPVVNEGARLLEEGVALRASDIDVAVILGYNWPTATGGPMFWADTVGLARVIERLRAFGHAPAPLLERIAAEGRQLSEC